VIKSWKSRALKNQSVLLLFSGGFDSTFCALTLRRAGAVIHALTLRYPNRPAAEHDVCMQLAAQLAFQSHQLVDLPLHDWRDDPKRWASPRQEGWIPHRNLLMFGLGAHFASINDCRLIASGIRVWDTTAFTDSEPGFLRALEKLLRRSGHPVPATAPQLYLPLLDAHVPIHEFVRNDAPALKILERTWSCWRNGVQPCGDCAPCRTRTKFMTELRSDIRRC
jgi:7-cyano-7-deazaguanine synthase